jgi:hypothetical protein
MTYSLDTRKEDLLLLDNAMIIMYYTRCIGCVMVLEKP